jgi:hypothetical protein
VLLVDSLERIAEAVEIAQRSGNCLAKRLCQARAFARGNGSCGIRLP